MTPLTFTHIQSCRLRLKYALNTSRLSLVQIMQKLSVDVRNVHEVTGKGAEIQLVQELGLNDLIPIQMGRALNWKLLAQLVGA